MTETESCCPNLADIFDDNLTLENIACEHALWPEVSFNLLTRRHRDFLGTYAYGFTCSRTIHRRETMCAVVLCADYQEALVAGILDIIFYAKENQWKARIVHEAFEKSFNHYTDPFPRSVWGDLGDIRDHSGYFSLTVRKYRRRPDGRANEWDDIRWAIDQHLETVLVDENPIKPEATLNDVL